MRASRSFGSEVPIYMLSALLGLSAASVASGSGSGISFAVTQSFLDYARNATLPALEQVVPTLKLDNFSGDSASFQWSVSHIKIAEGVSCGLFLELQGNNTLAMSLNNLHLSLEADVHVREDIWPHPSFHGSVSGNADGSAVTALVSIGEDAGSGAATVALDSCEAHVSLHHLKIHGLSILDPVLDLVLSAIKRLFYHSIRKALCDKLILKKVVEGMLQPLLSSLTYVATLPLSKPFDGAAIDYHLSAAPRVVHPGPASSSTFLDVALLGEVFDDDRQRHSNLPPPVLPRLSEPLAGRHATLRVSAFPFNTLLWTFYTQRALEYMVVPSMLPAKEQRLLKTNFFKHLMPKLYAAYPDHNMTLSVSAMTLPHLTMGLGNITLGAHINLSFAVQTTPTAGGLGAGNATKSVFAFSLWSPFDAAVQLSAAADPLSGDARLAAKLDDVDVKLRAGQSEFGVLGPLVIALLSGPLNFVVNEVVRPLANLVLERGIDLPTFSQQAEGMNVSIALVNPVLELCEDYAMIGVDARMRLAPARL